MSQQSNPRSENPSARRRTAGAQEETFVEVALARRAGARRQPAGSTRPAQGAGRSRTFAVPAPRRDAATPPQQDGMDWCALWARYGEWMD